MHRTTKRKTMTILYGFILDEGIGTFLERGCRVSSFLQYGSTKVIAKSDMKVSIYMFDSNSRYLHSYNIMYISISTEISDLHKICSKGMI
jgi:hypothetical protein